MAELIVALTILVLAIVVIFRSVRIVPQGFHWTVERFGKFTRTVTPGLNFLVPIIENVGHKFNMMEQVLDIPPQDVISSDNALVTVDAVCFFQVLDAPKAAYQITDLPLSMRNIVMTNIRAVVGGMELDDILSNRDLINVELLKKVDLASDPWGVKATRVEIRDVTPPEDLVQAMATQMKAEREKRAQVLEAEGEREAAVKVAEGQKQSEILKAEGELEAARREAEARERLAEAEANATRYVSEAILSGDPRAINYFVAQKYVEALGKLAESNNNKVMMIPLEATSVIGSIAGIGDLAKNVIQSSGDSAVSPGRR